MTAIAYNFPPTRFVAENGIAQQVEHVLGEAAELMEARSNGWQQRMLEELADLEHSLETLWRMMAADHGEEFVLALFAQVRAKNEGRGYYDQPVDKPVDNLLISP